MTSYRVNNIASLEGYSEDQMLYVEVLIWTLTHQLNVNYFCTICMANQTEDSNENRQNQNP